jgi:hypothetical protein
MQRKEPDPLPPFIYCHERTSEEMGLIRLKSLDQALTGRFRECVEGADLNYAWTRIVRQGQKNPEVEIMGEDNMTLGTRPCHYLPVSGVRTSHG